MEEIIGATDATVWAMAKATELVEQVQKSQITNGDMVQQCLYIFSRLKEDWNTLCTNLTIFQSSPHSLDGLDTARQRTTFTFNAATQLYVRSIMDRDKRSSPQIQEAVDLTKKMILFATQSVFPVARSLYWPAFMCGALTNKDSDRETMKTVLRVGSETQDRFGNGASAIEALQMVWDGAPLNDIHKEVPWKEVLKTRCLLLI